MLQESNAQRVPQDEISLGMIVGLSLRGGLLQPHVTDWLLPGPRPGDDASPSEIADWVQAREYFVGAGPSVLATYMAAIQGAIDDWDETVLRTVLPELRLYLELLHQHWRPDDGEQYDERNVSRELQLDRGLAPAREVDPAKLYADKASVQVQLGVVMQDLAGVLGLAWRDGVPQLNGAMARASFVMGMQDLDISVLGDMAGELEANVAKHARESDYVTDALFDEALGRVQARIAGPGSTLIGGDAIPDEDLFFEYLAHRYAYAADTPLFKGTLAANGYCKESSLAFETKLGLAFYIVMPQGGAACGLPAIFVFRGTQLNDLNDIRTDLELQIGESHFRAVEEMGLKELLEGAAADCGGVRPQITGHSLGGALAQLAASRYPDLVDAVVTFQAPGLSRINHRMAKERLSEGHELTVRHYLADNDVVHLGGQRHLDGETILVSGLKLDGGLGVEWGYGHTDLLLFGHGMRMRLLAMGLAESWCPHQLTAYARLDRHPTHEGSAHEMVRSALSVGFCLARAFVQGDRHPALVYGHLRQLVADGLDQGDPSLARAALTLTGETAKSSVRGLGSIGGLVRRWLVHRKNVQASVPPLLAEQYAKGMAAAAKQQAEHQAEEIARVLADLMGGDEAETTEESRHGDV